jgi:hypothetical protein
VENGLASAWQSQQFAARGQEPNRDRDSVPDPGIHALDRRFIVLLSAVFGMVSPRELAEWLLYSRLEVRMQLQLHKLIWEPDARGV